MAAYDGNVCICFRISFSPVRRSCVLWDELTEIYRTTGGRSGRTKAMDTSIT